MTEKEQARLHTLSSPDRVLWAKPGTVLAGMDEVGRGPLAGPVVAACVVMPPIRHCGPDSLRHCGPDPQSQSLIPYINDSKKLSEKRREQLDVQIRKAALDLSLAWVWQDVIDEINILQATRRAFEQAFAGLTLPVTDVLIDALTGLDLPARQHILIHGDTLSYSIAAASIVAKVARDRYMAEQDALYPPYGFAKNKGYGTARHMAALREYGPCPLHRKTFIKNYV